MDGPAYVRVTVDTPWHRADQLGDLSVGSRTNQSDGSVVWYLQTAGFGQFVTPDEATADALLRDLLETYGALDLTD